MEFDSIIKKRKSVRSFKPKTASWKLILEAIDTANQGPFSGNINNLSYLIIENKDTIKEIAKDSKQSWIKEVGILIVVCSDDTHLENLYGERGRVYSRQQAGAAINTLLLKLVDLGLSACWVGAYQDEILKGKLKIPSQIQIEAIIPVGYEKPSPKRTRKKAELQHTLRWEKFNLRRRKGFFEESEHEPSLQE